jgi:hypothetical protein
MKRVEVKSRNVEITAVEVEPSNWWSRLLLRLAQWHYKFDIQ